MNFDEVTQRAMSEPTLADALAVACIWEAERAIDQAKRNDYQEWETCFRHVIKRVLKEYGPVSEERGHKTAYQGKPAVFK